jgi:hypothetical protein
VNRQKVIYRQLGSKAKEAFNAAKLAGVMGRYGYELTPVRNDDEGADFIAYRAGEPALLIQLKGRPDIRKIYQGKGLHIAFPAKAASSGDMYLVAHDELVEIFSAHSKALATQSWMEKGLYNTTAKWIYDRLEPYKLEA